MAGERQFAARRQGTRARHQPRHASHQCGDLAPELGLAGRLEMRGDAVPPAAVETPDVPHDERGLVVHRLQVRTIGESRRRLHLGHNARERHAGIHPRERLAHEELQPLRGVLERGAHAVGAEDRHAVAGHEHLRVARGHRAQRHRPLGGVALDLLRVARVGRHPEEKIAAEEHPARRPPDPRVVVRLAARVRQLETHLAHVETLRSIVGRLRVVVLRRPRRRNGELARVDEPVVGRGRAIAVEARGHVAVTDDARSGPPMRRGLAEKWRQPAHVVDVAVRVDRGRQRRRLPAAHGGERLVARAEVAGVDEQETGLRANGRHVREGVGEEYAGRDLLAGAGRANELGPFDLTAPEALGQRQHITHRAQSSSSLALSEAPRARRSQRSARATSAALRTSSSIHPRAAKRRCGRTPSSPSARA